MGTSCLRNSEWFLFPFIVFKLCLSELGFDFMRLNCARHSGFSVQWDQWALKKISFVWSSVIFLKQMINVMFANCIIWLRRECCLEWQIGAGNYGAYPYALLGRSTEMVCCFRLVVWGCLFSFTSQLGLHSKGFPMASYLIIIQVQLALLSQNLPRIARCCHLLWYNLATIVKNQNNLLCTVKISCPHDYKH